jgi:hypothetical protein
MSGSNNGNIKNKTATMTLQSKQQDPQDTPDRYHNGIEIGYPVYIQSYSFY